MQTSIWVCECGQWGGQIKTSITRSRRMTYDEWLCRVTRWNKETWRANEKQNNKNCHFRLIVFVPEYKMLSHSTSLAEQSFSNWNSHIIFVEVFIDTDHCDSMRLMVAERQCNEFDEAIADIFMSTSTCILHVMGPLYRIHINKNQFSTSNTEDFPLRAKHYVSRVTSSNFPFDLLAALHALNVIPIYHNQSEHWLTASSNHFLKTVIF